MLILDMSSLLLWGIVLVMQHSGQSAVTRLINKHRGTRRILKTISGSMSTEDCRLSEELGLLEAVTTSANPYLPEFVQHSQHAYFNRLQILWSCPP